MLEKIGELPPGIDGLKAIGKISRQDYESVLEPLIEEARREGRRLRFLYQFGPEFDGFTVGAAWEDAKTGLRSMQLFDGCAVVSDLAWLRESVRMFGFLMPCSVRVFGNNQRADAIEWLATLLTRRSLTARLLPELGVIVVEVTAPLRAQDFDTLAVTADTWIEAHGNLQGLVIHGREFPGWENLGSLLRHVRFMGEHQRKVRKIALAVDGKLASLAPRMAEHFVSAELKHFTYGQLEEATAWARDSTSHAQTAAAAG